MTIELRIGQRTYCCQVKGKTAMVTVHPIEEDPGWLGRFVIALEKLIKEMEKPDHSKEDRS